MKKYIIHTLIRYIMIRAFCCSGIFIVTSITFLYTGVVMYKHAEGNETEWIVNGTGIHTSTNCIHSGCYDVYNVNVHGYKYYNASVTNYCVYTKTFTEEEDAKQCQEDYVDGSVHHWHHDGHECYNENAPLTIAITLIVFGSCITLIFLSIGMAKLYHRYKKENNTDIIETPLMDA